MSKIAQVLTGTIIHSKTFSEIEILTDRVVGIRQDGTISFIDELKNMDQLRQNWPADVQVTEIKAPKFIIPGFLDSHIHAPQYSFTGTGYDLPLLQWLEKYTFPAEECLSDQSLAEKVYSNVIDQTLSHGTTTAAYYATIDLEATKTLVRLLYEKGQRAFVGKVNMDRNSPDNYTQTTETSFEETKQFVRFTQEEREKRATERDDVADIHAILTPRFVPSCTPELLQKLGELAEQEKLFVQSHISENRDEVQWVTKDLHPDMQHYSGVYDHFGLLTNRCVMGHGVYLSEEELQLFAKRGAGISHCPISNFALRSGIFNVRRAKSFGVKVGLGSDVSGGYSPSMIEVMRQAVIASTSIYFQEPEHSPLSYKEVFYLATLGNAELLGMEDRVGSFAPGKSFDALIVDPQQEGSSFHNYDHVASSLSDVFQKFVFLGSSVNIREVFVQGRSVLKK